MGVTIHYRGSLANLDRIEDFEDRVLDLALELGGQAHIWRSTCDDNPRRVVRGVHVNLFPGQETMSLLVSPEGWLVGLAEIEEAEKGELDEPPWCFVKTQFGPLEGHVALVEMLAALKREFLPDLEVHDEGDYWETRDLDLLARKMAFLQAAIDSFGKHLQRYGLSREAAEDPEIVIARIQRIAELVQRTLGRPAEHPPVRWGDDEGGNAGEDAPSDNESQWDASYKENRRRQERVHRAIEEHLARGDDYDEAFDRAMHEETSLGLPAEPAEPAESDEGWHEEEQPDDWAEDDADDEEPWKESLRDSPDDAPEGFCDPIRHPLQRQASDLLMRLHRLFGDSRNPHVDTLMRGVGEIGGGLAQALGMGEDDDEEDEVDDFLVGLAVVQLKRALRGAAFAFGALFPLAAEGSIDEGVFEELRGTIEKLQSEILEELRRVRQRGNA